jgi:hypothetical protein
MGVVQLSSLPGVVLFGFDARDDMRNASKKRPLCASSTIDTSPVIFPIKKAFPDRGLVS